MLEANNKQIAGDHYKKYADLQPVYVEAWLPIPLWDTYYEASNYGRIRSCVRILEVYGKHGWYRRAYGGVILKPKLSSNGYQEVNLWKNNVGHMQMVHRLIYSAFNPEIEINGLVINHINHNRKDNRLSNLEAITQRDNLQKAAEFYGYSTIGQFISESKTSRRDALPKT